MVTKFEGYRRTVEGEYAFELQLTNRRGTYDMLENYNRSIR
jgi:hypothetical protein